MSTDIPIISLLKTPSICLLFFLKEKASSSLQRLLSALKGSYLAPRINKIAMSKESDRRIVPCTESEKRDQLALIDCQQFVDSAQNVLT